MEGKPKVPSRETPVGGANNLREHKSKPSHIQEGSVIGYSENYEYKVIDMLKETQTDGLKY